MDRVVELLKKLADLHEENNKRMEKEIKIYDILMDNTITDEGKLTMIAFVLST